MPIEVQPPSVTGSVSCGVGEQVRQVGHDLRNLLTIFIGVTETLEGLPQRDAPVEDGLRVLRTLGTRLQGLAENLRDIGRQADQLPACDAATLARDLSALEPDLGSLARAYRSTPMLRAREGDIVRLWTIVTLGAQRLGGFRNVPECKVVSDPRGGYACQLQVSFARTPLPPELRQNLEKAAQPLGALLTLSPDDSTVTVGIPVA